MAGSYFDHSMGVNVNLKPVVLAVLTGLSGASHAVSGDWGAHDSIEQGFNLFFGGSIAFTDTWAFTVSGPSTLLVSAVTNDAPPVYDVINGTLQLFAGVPSSGTVVGTPLLFDSTAVNKTFSVGAGSYYYQLSGATSPGALGGSYLVASTLAPIPEPGTYALMIAGLGVAGFVARRRGQRA